MKQYLWENYNANTYEKAAITYVVAAFLVTHYSVAKHYPYLLQSTTLV